MKTSAASILLWLVCLAFVLEGRSAELQAGFAEETLATNLNAATAIVPVADGRILIAEQTGNLLIWKDGRILEQPALTLHVTDYWERGLIGVALHPDYPRTPHLFALYVTDRPFVHHLLSRFAFIADRVDPASEVVLLEGDDQAELGGRIPWGHQGGPVRFGPDGKIYVALGEQTAGQPSQRLDSLLGKILRLNSDGSVPVENPFFQKTTGKYRAIWAYGLRNPFGLAFQQETGRLFETDVGESSWEEVNEILQGANYGWPLAEGFSTNSSFKNPVYAYPPVIGRCIVGAVFYPRSSQNPGGLFPEKWRGKLFFGDWAAHWIKALDPEAPTNVLTFGRGFNGPVAAEIAPDNSLLVLNRGTIWRNNKNWQPNSGSLVRVRYAGPGAMLAEAMKSRGPLPRTLAATGLFKALEPLEIDNSFTRFEVNLPPWQPGVQAQRWIKVPKGARLKVDREGEFEFPNRTIVVQHYRTTKSSRSFETHVMWFTAPRVARAAAYRWDAQQSAATLIEEGEIISLPDDPARHWFSPGTEENLNLDTVVSSFLLPLNLRQINRAGQLAKWNERGWFNQRLHPEEIAEASKFAAPDDDSASLELRVRSYLDVNCAGCHRPGGPSRGNFDARFNTPLPRAGMVDRELLAGDLGINGAHIVSPGEPERSILLQRIRRKDFFRMPPVSINDEPSPILPVMEEWIRSLRSDNSAKQ